MSELRSRSHAAPDRHLSETSGSLPNIGADFRIFEEYARIHPNVKAQIEALPLDEQNEYMGRLATVLGKDPDAKITDISQLGMAPPPLPTREDAEETKIFQAAKSRPISEVRAKNVPGYRGSEALTTALPVASGRKFVRPQEALTIPRPKATGKPKAPQADEEPTRVIQELADGDIEDVKSPTAAQLAAAIRGYKGA